MRSGDIADDVLLQGEQTLVKNTVMQNDHIHWSSAALSYTNIRSNTTPSLLIFIGTTDTATLNRDQSMPPTTTSKLFPLDAPIPSTFLRDIPIEPWLTGDCRVDHQHPSHKKQ
jgi:hypothetical protein